MLIGVGILEENEELQATCTLQSEGHQAAWSPAAPTASCLVLYKETSRSREVWGCQTEMHRALRPWAALGQYRFSPSGRPWSSTCFGKASVRIHGHGYLRNFFQELWKTQHPPWPPSEWHFNLEICSRIRLFALLESDSSQHLPRILELCQDFRAHCQQVTANTLGCRALDTTRELEHVRSSQRRRTTSDNGSKATTHKLATPTATKRR